MSDLDFDELDKAVNTLMGDVPKVEPPKADEVKTLNINSTLPDESRPSLEKLNSELSRVNSAAPSSIDKAAVSSPAPTPSLATRRGGRFMDVVHPSSDMKGVPKTTTPMSRQGVTIEPVSPSGQVGEERAGATSPIDTTVNRQFTGSDTSVADVASEPSNDNESSKSDWPDPLDMTAYAAEPDTGNIATAVTANAPAVSLAVTDIDDDTDTQPLNSPFLADAKVEKRPLGGSPVEDVKADDNEPSRTPALGVVSADDAAVEDAAEQLPADPTMVDQPLPPELRSDLMAIETDGGTSATAVKPQEENKVPVNEKPEEKKQDTPVPPVADKKPLSESVVATSTVAAVPNGPTSIPQQYHEEPTTSDQTNGAIYDTDSYHQPLAHPAKTNSGWLWIIWILLLLMVGGGGAVALYFLGII